MTPTPSGTFFPLLDEFRALEVLVEEELLDDFRRMKELDEPGPVRVEGHVVGFAVGVRFEDLEFLLGERRGDMIAGVEPGQGADPVPTVLLAEGPDIRKLHVAPGSDFLTDIIVVVLVVHVVDDLPAFGVHRPEHAVIEVEGAVLADEAEVVRRKLGEAVDDVLVLPMVILEKLDGRPGPFDDLVDVERRGAFEKAVPLLGAEVFVDAPGDRSRAVDLLPRRGQDDLLAELAQEDGLDGQILVEGDDADDVPDGRVGVHAQEKIRRGEVEEMQGMGLEHLAVVHEPAHFLSRWREPFGPDPDDDVHGLGRGQVMADRANAAEPLDEDRGLPIGPALNEALEAAELDDVETGLGHFPGVIEKDGDLAVAFHPGDRFDRDLSRHSRSPFNHT
jgi:hypothetical protein